MGREDIKKQITIAVVLVFTVSVILILTGSLITLSIKQTQEREAQKYMKEIVSQYKNIIAAQIEGDMQTLDTVDLNATLPYLEDYLKEMSGRNDFIRMGFVSSDYRGYFIDADGQQHYDIDVSGEDFLRKALAGDRVVSDLSEDRMSANSVIFYGVPVICGGKVTGAVTATRKTSDLAEIISRDIFDGIAFIHIVDQDGDFIVRSDHAVIQKQMDNIFVEGVVTEEMRLSILSDS